MIEESMIDDEMKRGPVFTSVPIEILVCVGHARPAIRDLLRLEDGAVLPLDKRIDDPVELYVGDRLIGLGILELVEGSENGQLAVRLTETNNVRPRA